jgi:hypothetical protein
MLTNLAMNFVRSHGAAKNLEGIDVCGAGRLIRACSVIFNSRLEMIDTD